MKNFINHSLLPLLFILTIIAGCRNNNNYTDNCIHYVDSLRIDLGDKKLRVAFIKPELEHEIRPYALIYNDHLIVLNNFGEFYTFSIDCFERNTIFEKQLNKTYFKRAFVLGNLLYGIDENNESLLYNDSRKNWEKVEIPLPFGAANPVYEDEKYVCYSVCHGEFGGAVFFFNKISHQTTFLPSYCLSCVMKKKDGYYVISNLKHGSGGSNIIGINNPDSLIKYPDHLFANDGWREMHEQKMYELEKNDTSAHSQQTTLDFCGDEILISSGFTYHDNHYFLTRMAYKTYLTKLKYDSTGAIIKKESILELPDNCIFILRHDELDTIPAPDTIFSKLPASSGEITYKINDVTVINYARFANNSNDWLGYPSYNLLVTTFIQRDSSLIRIDWTKYEYP